MTHQPIVSVRILFAAFRKDLNWNYPSLSAPYWRFYWNTSGPSRIRLPIGEHPLSPRVGYIIPPDTEFSSIAETVIDHFFVHFTVGYVHQAIVPGVYTIDRRTVLEPLVEALIGKVSSPNVNENDTSLTLLAASLVTAALSSIPIEVTPVLPGTDSPLSKAIHYIDAHLDEKLTIEEIAGFAGCSERSLRRRFHAVFDHSPSSFIAIRRVERACILLHFSDHTIDEIAELSGFYDRYHLTHTFRRQRGVGPAQFRRTRLETELRS